MKRLPYITPKGEVVPNTWQMDGQFCQFEEMKYGWRAAFLLLKKYINVKGCDTIRKIINKWAPPSENDTAGYIDYVVNMSGGDADSVIDFNTVATLNLAAAMCVVENGVRYDPFAMGNEHLLNAMCEGQKMAQLCVDYQQKKKSDQ